MEDQNFNPFEIVILKIIQGHQGRGNAVRREDLIDRVNQHYPWGPIHDRTIRKTIKHLTTQHKIPIGSCGEGYFLAVTAEEIENVCKYYDGYGLSSLYVSASLRKIEMRDFLGQLAMKFENR